MVKVGLINNRFICNADRLTIYATAIFIMYQMGLLSLI